MTALMAASRTAMEMLGTASGSNPARAAKSSAVFSTELTLSSVEGRVRETRFVGSDNRITLTAGGEGIRGFSPMKAVCLEGQGDVKDGRRAAAGERRAL